MSDEWQRGLTLNHQPSGKWAQDGAKAYVVRSLQNGVQGTPSAREYYVRLDWVSGVQSTVALSIYYRRTLYRRVVGVQSTLACLIRD